MRNPEHHDRTTTLPLQSASSFNDGISDPLFSSEPSLIQTSFLESSYNFVEHSTSPSIQPISSPLPLDDDKPAYEHENAISEPTAAPPMLAIRRTSPKPTKNETTNGDQSKDNNNKSEKHFDTSFLGLGEQESRFEFQSELSSFAEGNVSDLGISDKNRSEHHQAKVKEGDAQKEKSTNFTLKLKIYHLEKQLNKVAPEHVDQALRENVNLKVQVSTLSRELQRYKKMLLDSHKAMSILQRNQQTCTKPHISPEEEDEYHAARLEAAQFRDENERLQKLINELSADNNKLRASARSSRNSSPLMEALRVSRSNSNSSGRHSDDLDPDHWNYRNNGANYELELCRRELRQANQKIERQNQIIQSLRDERSVVRGGGGTYDAGSDHLVKTILTNRDELARTNTEIREVSIRGLVVYPYLMPAFRNS
ncbi:microtubule associated-domain-containing protein [Syncephalastrum racemosum]|uniref:Microtubule associated-domain-containing protein n=1 Tax=Syncephalastrum racemosum TaxID=13706 RepID=A0A1X2HAB5_SYNRA|nr:microtubule associated-domain-containing protein [Syncephalastrum racemosum]